MKTIEQILEEKKKVVEVIKNAIDEFEKNNPGCELNIALERECFKMGSGRKKNYLTDVIATVIF